MIYVAAGLATIVAVCFSGLLPTGVMLLFASMFSVMYVVMKMFGAFDTTRGW